MPYGIMICCRAACRVPPGKIHNQRLRSYNDDAATAPWVWDCRWGFSGSSLGFCLGERMSRGEKLEGGSRPESCGLASSSCWCQMRLWRFGLSLFWSVLDLHGDLLGGPEWKCRCACLICTLKPIHLQADVTYPSQIGTHWGSIGDDWGRDTVVSSGAAGLAGG